MGALLELRRVSKEYASGDAVVRALKDVDLTIDSGEFVAIVGTSGSGKSTLMNILGCLDRPSHGRYQLAGIDAGQRTNDARALVRNRLIGFIFQGFNLLSRTTALENCELPLQYRGIPAGARRARAREALEAVGLGDRTHHTPNQLSGGQQQRVAIARALVTDPPLLLADEPTGNLDTRTSLEVLALLQKLNRDRGITIVLVTHERDIAACASRIITVRDGRIVSDVREPSPVDAQTQLQALPPAEVYAPREGDDEDPAAALRRRLGGPVPFAVFAATLLGGVLGAGLGLGYTKGILDVSLPLVPVVLALLGEAWVGSRVGRRLLGRPLTADQRGRVALWYTLGTTLLLSPGLALAGPGAKGPVAARFEALTAGGPVLTVGVLVAMVVALSLLRYLLFSLLAPRR